MNVAQAQQPPPHPTHTHATTTILPTCGAIHWQGQLRRHGEVPPAASAHTASASRAFRVGSGVYLLQPRKSSRLHAHTSTQHAYQQGVGEAIEGQDGGGGGVDRHHGCLHQQLQPPGGVGVLHKLGKLCVAGAVRVVGGVEGENGGGKGRVGDMGQALGGHRVCRGALHEKCRAGHGAGPGLSLPSAWGAPLATAGLQTAH